MPKARGGNKKSGMIASNSEIIKRIRGEDEPYDAPRWFNGILQKADDEGISVPAGMKIIVLDRISRFSVGSGAEAYGQYRETSNELRIATAGKSVAMNRWVLAHELGHANHHLIHPDSKNWSREDKEIYADEVAMQLTGLKSRPTR